MRFMQINHNIGLCKEFSKTGALTCTAKSKQIAYTHTIKWM